MKQKKKYLEILDNELRIINKSNWSDFFLLLSDLVCELKNKNFIFSFGRGSSVSSLVVFLLGITEIDPVENNLFFARFLNEFRETMPDVDLDVENQEEIFNYLFQNYNKKIFRITIKRKIGLKLAVNEIVKLFPLNKELIRINSLINTASEEKINSWKKEFPIFFSLVDKISNLFYNVSLHPSGIIFFKETPTDIPFFFLNNFPTILFEQEELTSLNLKKIDFISLKDSLFLLKNFEKICQEKLPNALNLKLDNYNAWNLLGNFLLTGVFQLDTSTAFSLFIKIKPKNFSELIMFLALNRPGCVKKIDEFIKYKRKKKELEVSQKIKEIVSETYNCVLFEEQISQLISVVYNLSFEESEIERRKILKNIPSREEFFSKIKNEDNFSQKDLIFFYEQIVNSCKYTFNKAHAVAYAKLTYYYSFLKANFFDKLISFWINKNILNTKKIIGYLQEAFFLGYEIILPDINYSKNETINKEKKIFIGFNCFKNEKLSIFFTNIIFEREKKEFKNFLDFLVRTSSFWPEQIEKSFLEKLFKINFFRSLGIDGSFAIDINLNIIFLFIKLKKKLNLQNENISLLPEPFFFSKKKKESIQEINEIEKKVFDLNISFFSRWLEIYKKHKITSFLENLSKFYDNEEKKPPFFFKVYALINEISLFSRISNDFFTLILSDSRSQFKVFIKRWIYEKKKRILTVNNELIFHLDIIFKASEHPNLYFRDNE